MIYRIVIGTLIIVFTVAGYMYSDKEESQKPTVNSEPQQSFKGLGN